MREREDGAHSSFRTVVYLVAIPLAGMAVFFLWQWLNGGITPEEAARETKAAVVPSPRAARIEPGLRGPQTEKKGKESEDDRAALPRVRAKSRHRGDIVLIIDDLGFDGQPLDRVMALDPNLNCAVLPNGTSAGETARRLHQRGFEILCHLPMQPRGRELPGRDAILTSMPDDEIARLTRENIGAVPHARGVNNHMGSLATADERVMRAVIGAIPEGLYFVDSRTSGQSVAAAVAKKMSVPTAARSVFLDDVATEKAVARQVEALAGAAERHGVAIGIGHPYRATLAVLERELPALKARGFRLLRASQAVR